MTSEPLRFQRDYEFAPVIVWDALLDSDLVSGWLAEAFITPEAGGEYNLHWVHRPDQPQAFGRITLLHPLSRLHIDSATAGRIEFALDEVEGGFRGTSTRLSVAVDPGADALSVMRVTADWLSSLDQLDSLLRGHPVDWSNWDRDHREGWLRYFDALPGSTA
jgi:uncharacterized protein YndB with AHSA1/START domain